MRLPGLVDSLRVVEAAKLTGYFSLGVLIVLMSEFLVFSREHVVLMLFRQNLLVIDRLDGRVIVMLVDLSVNCLGDFLMSVRVDGFLRHSRVYDLIDGGLVASVGGELVHGVLCGFHVDDKLYCRLLKR